MPEDFTTTLTHADTRDFLRGVSVTTYTGAQADELLRINFQDPQAQQDAFVALAECGLELVPLAH